MLDKIVISKDKKSAIVHFESHKVILSSDQDVTSIVHEMFIEPETRFQRSLEETAWIIQTEEKVA